MYKEEFDYALAVLRSGSSINVLHINTNAKFTLHSIKKRTIKYYNHNTQKYGYMSTYKLLAYFRLE